VRVANPARLGDILAEHPFLLDKSGGRHVYSVGMASPKDVSSRSSEKSGGVISTDEYSKTRWLHMLTVVAKLELASQRRLVVTLDERKQLLDELFQYLEEMNDELPKDAKNPPRDRA